MGLDRGEPAQRDYWVNDSLPGSLTRDDCACLHKPLDHIARTVAAWVLSPDPASSGRHPERLLDVLQQQEQVEGINRRRLKSEPFIEGLRAVILGMHDNRPPADTVRRLDNADQGVSEERCSQAGPLGALIHRQTRQQDDGNGVAGKALGNSLRSILQGDRTRCDGVIANDLLVAQDDIGARGTVAVIGVGKPLEVLVQRSLPAGKCVRAVVRVEEDWRSECFQRLSLQDLKGLGPEKSCLSLGRSWAGRSSAEQKASHCFLGSAKSTFSATTL